MSTADDEHQQQEQEHGTDDATDEIDAALSELEKMLNDNSLLSSLSPAGPNAADGAAYNHAAVHDCTQIPRLTAQLAYARSHCLFIRGILLLF